MKMVYSVLIVCGILCVATGLNAQGKPCNSSNGEAARYLSNFAFDLQRVALGREETSLQNVVLSPTSIAAVLSLLLVGSYGKTYEEIANTLGFFEDKRCSQHSHQNFGKMLGKLADNHEQTRKLHIANGIFLDEYYCVRPQYQFLLKSIYHANITPVDFGSSITKTIVNSWVSEMTFGKIENVLQKSPSRETKLLVINTLYFNNEWLHHFGPQSTSRVPFMLNKSTTDENIFVDMMATVATFPYLYSNELGVKMVGLPYKDGRTVLYAIMPINSRKLPLTNLILMLNNEYISFLISKLKLKSVAVALPKMNLKHKVDLKNMLRNVGISALFSPAEANLALLSSGQCENNEEEKLFFVRLGSDDEDTEDDPTTTDYFTQSVTESDRVKRSSLDRIDNPGLYVDEILHDVRMNITEVGTEAAAATVAYSFRTSEGRFRADEPFIFFIRDEETKLILFTASIFKPDPYYESSD